MIDMRGLVGRTTSCWSRWTRCATTWPPSCAAPAARRTWRAVLPGGAWERRHTPGELHLRRAPRVLRRVPADPDGAGSAPAAVRRPVPRQRDDRRRHLGLRRARRRHRAGRRRLPHGLRRRRRLLQPALRRWAACCPACSPRATGRPSSASPTRARSRPSSTVDRARRPAPAAAVPVPQRLGAAPAQPPLPARAPPRTAGPATRPRWRTSTATSAACSPALPRRGRPCLVIVCSDHGTAYGEDGHIGHRVGPRGRVDGAVRRVRPHAGRSGRDDASSTARRTRATSTPTRTRRRTARCGRARPLRDVWARERRDALFLYLHVPFCEMRCGFCNLFTRANPRPTQVDGATCASCGGRPTRSRDAIGPARFAAGGDRRRHADLPDRGRARRELLEVVTAMTGRRRPCRCRSRPRRRPRPPTGWPCSPRHGVHRVSIGVQSFLDAEAHAAGRPQRRAEVEAALAAIRAAASRCSTST